MWLTPLAGLLALAASSLDVRAQAPSGQPPLPEPISTRQTLFAIPFRMDEAELPDQEPVEVHLYVSADQGTNWHLYSKAEPQRGHFLFRAGGDGEFWFQIRTMDRSGRLRPETNNRPGLRVVVDTTAPELRLTAVRGQPGQITAKWRVTEPNLDFESLKIQYRTDTHLAWQFVAVDREGVTAAGPLHQGEVTWWPPPGGTRVEIRAEVADLAGNPAVTHEQVNLSRGPGGESRRTSDPTPGPTTAVTGADRATGPGWRASVDRPPQTFPTHASPDPSLADRSTVSGPVSSQQAPAKAYSEVGTSIGQRFSRWDGPVEPEKSNDAEAMSQPTHGSVAVQSNPPIGNDFVPSDASSADLAAPDGLPPGQRPRTVNARVFELEYDVESVGPSGIDRVELWGTRDGGRTWSSFGTDDDHRSPLLVTVGEEGVYGFRITVQSGVGLGGQKPRSGDQPELWILVDQTKPYASITSAEQVAGQQVGRLIIHWQATDRMLADRPVSLFYSDMAGGPWALIAGGLENTGEYSWTLDRRAAERVYLRLEVRDAAGNLGVYETPKAIMLDQLRPVVRIRDVRPLSPSARTAPRRYFSR